jgi:hypothetical protein
MISPSVAFSCRLPPGGCKGGLLRAFPFFAVDLAAWIVVRFRPVWRCVGAARAPVRVFLLYVRRGILRIFGKIDSTRLWNTAFAD